MMNCVPVKGDGEEACANCGKLGSDTVKLKNCTACRLVKYCGVDCQRAHRKQHKKACRKRAAELKDEQLYSQGLERPEGDFCPICTLPIPLPMHEHSDFAVCCMKRICNGCHFAAQKRGMSDCPFCRTPYPSNDADILAMVQARVAKKDPEAINFLGNQYFHEGFGLQKDMHRAVKLWTEAAGLGSIQALYNLGVSYEYGEGPGLQLYHLLGVSYDRGEGVQQDVKKAIEIWSNAAMQGDVRSRHNLGVYERDRDNEDRALRHWMIAAKMGYEESVDDIK